MKKKRFLTTLAAAALAASMLSALPASAANYDSTKWATGDSKTIKKYLVLDKKANVPAATFSYTIAAGTPVNYSGTDTVAAYAGVDANKITVGSATFTSASHTANGATGDGITNSGDKKFATSTFTVDFSEVKFKEPGVYRYVLTETGAGTTDNLGGGISHVGNYQKTLDVYVTDSNGMLSVSSYVLYNSLLTTPPQLATEVVALDENVDRTDTANTDKTDGFVNEYSSQSLSFAKRVTGNQGSKDKYFKFTVTITNALGATLNINGAKSNFEKNTTANSATATTYTTAVMNAANAIDQNATLEGQQLVIDSNSKVYTFYLQDGQYITLDGLPKGATYAVSEANEEYTSTVTDANDNKFTYGTIEFKNAASGTIGTADVATGFTNNKDGSIPTGVILSIAGPAVVGLAVIGGLIFMIIKRKKEDSED